MRDGTGRAYPGRCPCRNLVRNYFAYTDLRAWGVGFKTQNYSVHADFVPLQGMKFKSLGACAPITLHADASEPGTWGRLRHWLRHTLERLRFHDLVAFARSVRRQATGASVLSLGSSRPHAPQFAVWAQRLRFGNSNKSYFYYNVISLLL